MPINQKGIAHLFLLILLVIGIGVGIYLVQNPAIFKPKASEIASAVDGDDYNFADELTVATLQTWYNSQKGLWQNPGSDSWRDPYWWDSANALESIERSIVRTNGQEYQNIISNTYDKNINGSPVNPSPNFINDFHDDEQWWALAWIRAYDITGDTRYLNTAKTLAADVASQWTNSCGGGIKWRKSDDYKAADQNLLFILLTLRLHQRTPGDTQYLGWAQNTWNWFKNSGMVNGNNHINNGLDKTTCQNDGGVVWSYNMGDAIGALVEFYKITGDVSYLTQAETFANASLSYLVDSQGILEDQCQKAYWINAGYDSCDKIDAANFKGIFIRNLAALYDIDHNSTYYDFLVKNARSNWNQNRDGNQQFGLNWSGPLDRADVPRQTAASFTFSSLAHPYTQAMLFIRGSGDKSFSHELGAPAPNLAWKCNNSICNRPGLMQGGPFVSHKPLVGNHTAHYRLKVSDLSTSSGTLAELIIKKNGQSIAQKNVLWSEFTEANKSQNFDLAYSNPSYGDRIEYQVVWKNIPNSPELTIEDTSVDGQINLLAANLNHQLGQLDIYNNWFAYPAANNSSGMLSQGPGIKLENGNYTAQFELKVDNFNLDNAKIATISVLDVDTNQVIATQDIFRSNFSNTLFKTFPLSFTSNGHHYDFRVFYHSSGTAPALTQRGVYIQGVGQNPQPAPGTGAGVLNANPNPCTIASGSSTCTSTIGWNAPGESDVKITIKEVPGSLFASGPSGSQAAPWIGSAGVTFQAYAGTRLIGELLVKGLASSSNTTPASPSPVTGRGILNASPNPCAITSGETCTSNISWNSTDPNLKITIKEVPGSLFASGPSGSQAAPWIRVSGATFEAYSGTTLVDSLFVKGVTPVSPPSSSSSPSPSVFHPVLSASPNPCQLNSAASCTSRISWNSNYPDLKISLKEVPGSLFASGPYGYQDAPWISSAGITFEARAGGQVVDTLFVKGN